MLERLPAEQSPTPRFRVGPALRRRVGHLLAAACLLVLVGITAFLFRPRGEALDDLITLRVTSGHAEFQNESPAREKPGQVVLRQGGKIVARGPALPTIEAADYLQIVMNLGSLLTWEGRGGRSDLRFSLHKGEVFCRLERSSSPAAAGAGGRDRS